jgi:uncharacterized membrane-anchored protein YhcB (DUF1043 family)
MEQEINDLKTKIENLEKQVLKIILAQNKSAELFEKLAQKCSDNFINIQKSFENLTTSK